MTGTAAVSLRSQDRAGPARSVQAATVERTRYLALLLPGLLACQAQAPMTAAERSAIVQEVTAVADDIIARQNALDAEGVARHYTEGDLAWVQNTVRFRTHDEFAEWARNLFTSYWTVLDSDWNDFNVRPLTRDLAATDGTWWLVGTDRDGHTWSYDTIYWTALFERRDDGAWKITTGHQSWPDPPAESR